MQHSKIRCSLFLSKIVNKIRTIREIALAAVILGIAIVKDLFIPGWHRRRHVSEKLTARNIIIVGGELFNKGAQAMTFTVVDQMKRKFPNRSIYVFSQLDFDRKEEEKSIYTFNIFPWYLGIKIRLLDYLGIFHREDNNFTHIENHMKEIIKNAKFFIDISGYGLTSQLDFLSSVNYLLNIIVAKRFSIPYYIFPQSIGPFDYRLRFKIFLYHLMRLYLKYPEKIFLREEEGIKCVRKFTQNNVEKSYDIVLVSKGYNLFNIYKKKVLFKDIKIEPSAVGIIPNLNVIKRSNPGKLFSVYNYLIKRLLDANKTIYLLRHSYNDLGICEKIKSLFSDNKSVRLISDDLNAIELENIIKQFDFVITSRYHSIIHAYKNGTPALVIGWANKYFELLKSFNQLDYFFDVRDKMNVDEMVSSLDKLIQNFKYEKEKIINKMNILNKKNIFNIFVENNF